ncbi:MAG: hypothetical protein AB1778_09325 [Candidatus Bipolaricaulota bacterium]
MTGRWVPRSSTVLLLCLAVVLAGRAQSIIDLPRRVPSFNQAYSIGPGAWGRETLGTGGCPDLLQATGCLVTAFAAVLAYYEVSLEIPPEFSSTGQRRVGMDPGILNDWLRARAGYGPCATDPAGSCCLEWDRLPYGIDLSFHVNRSEVSLNPIAAIIIDHALRQGSPIVAGVHWSAYCRSGSTQSEDCHWVVITGKMGSTYTIMDPFNRDSADPQGLTTTLSAGSRGRYIVDRFAVVERAAGEIGSANALWVDPPVSEAAPLSIAAPEPVGPSPWATILALMASLSLIAAAIWLGSRDAP